MDLIHREWLVTDQRGNFAMGTPQGVRTRKYHGFFMGMAGRAQTAFLSDLEIECNGISLWPHCYWSPEGPIFFPDLEQLSIPMSYQQGEKGPSWSWNLPDGVLGFRVERAHPGGIALKWRWEKKESNSAPTCLLKVRAFWSFRDLHSLGGNPWSVEIVDWNNHSKRVKIIPDGSDFSRSGRMPSFLVLPASWKWKEDPKWYEQFHYSEEVKRGYPADENLYSAGVFETSLYSKEDTFWVLAQDVQDLKGNRAAPGEDQEKRSFPIQDFVLTRPAGVVAGFPWFGEWGRDTFVSLPGIVISRLEKGENPDQLWSWALEVLHRWGSYIESKGMLPNLIETEGRAQWDSADATLWWCHSLAALWSFSLGSTYSFPDIRIEFRKLLNLAIESIRQGTHLHLKLLPSQLVEVTAAHTTWMDARQEGEAITPRTGLLPEINALWFEARCLQWLWLDHDSYMDVEEIGRAALECQELDRPNSIFLHSLPLAPSFILKEWDVLERDLMEIAEKFWTPVGLRTLSPKSPRFHPRCIGTQAQRDLAYHQGSAWGWLGGHFEMALYRLATVEHLKPVLEKILPKEILNEMPILGHISELFDGEQPFTPRGAPAQAWSLACLEEAHARNLLKVDAKLSKVLARRREM